MGIPDGSKQSEYKLIRFINFINNENILETPIWYNEALQIRINRGWCDKGIDTIWDLMGEDKKS